MATNDHSSVFYRKHFFVSVLLEKSEEHLFTEMEALLLGWGTWRLPGAAVHKDENVTHSEICISCDFPCLHFTVK